MTSPQTYAKSFAGTNNPMPGSRNHPSTLYPTVQPVLPVLPVLSVLSVLPVLFVLKY